MTESVRTLVPPPTDPSPVFDALRGAAATELLACAVAEFDLFSRLAAASPTFDELRSSVGLAMRPANVLFTALRAMGLMTRGIDGRYGLTPAARVHLLPDSPHYVGDYVALAAGSPGVRAMAERLRTDRPAGTEPPRSATAGTATGPATGAAFIYREGLESAMEHEAEARRLTLALAGRARCVAPVLAERLPLPGARFLLDVGGGTGLYATAYLQRHPDLRAAVWDRPEVLKVTAETAAACGVADRLACMAGDMFADPVPAGADVVLLSNVLHDWDEPACRRLIARLAAALPSGGRLLIHDVLLDDDLGGPLPTALYSAVLFGLTEGRAYSAAEYAGWLAAAGLWPERPLPTSARCSVIVGRKP